MTEALDRENSEMMSFGDRKSTPLNSSNAVEFDNVLHALGSSLRHQLLQVWIVLLFLLPGVGAVFNFIIIGYEPPHMCAETNETQLLNKYFLLNDTTSKIVYETCRIRITSNQTGHPEDVALTGCVSGHRYQGGKDVTLTAEWDLVCEKNGIGELVYTMFNVGMAVGSIAINPLADKIGHKYVILFCCVVGTVFEFGQVFSQSVYVMMVLKLISGLALQNMSFTPYILGAEVLVTKHRHLYGAVSILFWTCFSIIFGIVSYALRSYSWRVLQLCSSLTGILPLLFIYFLKDSIPWLFAKGRHARALAIIQNACKTNGANYELAKSAYGDCIRHVSTIQEADNNRREKHDFSKYGLIDIIRHKRLLITTLILCLTWFTHSVTYTGLYLTSSTLNQNRYFMFIILAATEIPSTLLCLFLLSRLGRRSIIIFFLSSSSICLLCSALLIGLGDPTSKTVSNASTAFFILGKFSVNISFTCLYCFTNEQYPTTVRSTGSAICAFSTRVGAMVSPFLHPLYRISNWAPGTLLSALCFVTVLLYTRVPETKGKELPTTIEEIEALYVKEGNKENIRLDV